MKAIIVSIIFLLLSFMAHGAELYHQEVNIQDDISKNLIIVFDEVESHDRFSIVKVTYTSGASVPTSMFLMKCVYEMAKLRKASYFIPLKDWTDDEGNWISKVGFTSDLNVDPFTYFGDDVDKNKPMNFMSVRDYDLLWENK